MRSWLRAGDPRLRWTLVRSLRFICLTTRSLQLLRALYEDKDLEIRRRAIQLVVSLYDPLSEQRRSVVDLLRRAEQDSARRVRDVVAEGKETHGDDYLSDTVLTPAE
jgi:HEAT repeat protein